MAGQSIAADLVSANAGDADGDGATRSGGRVNGSGTTVVRARPKISVPACPGKGSKARNGGTPGSGTFKTADVSTCACVRSDARGAENWAGKACARLLLSGGAAVGPHVFAALSARRTGCGGARSLSSARSGISAAGGCACRYAAASKTCLQCPQRTHPSEMRN